MITAAFLALTRVSQTSNRKLHDVADELIRQSVISDLAGPSGAPPYHLSWRGLTAHGLNRQT
jgi:hypothetical protein